MPKHQKDTHICKKVGGGLKDDCAVCLENLFQSRDPAVELKCGIHMMHSKCF